MACIVVVDTCTQYFILNMGFKDLLLHRGLYLGHLNIRSIFPKMDILQHVISELGNRMGIFDILETWLHEQFPDDLINIPGYTVCRNDRKWGNDPRNATLKKGGGVCLYLREGISFNAETFKYLNRSCNSLESQWVHIPNVFAKDVIIANCYRPPSGDMSDFLR